LGLTRRLSGKFTRDEVPLLEERAVVVPAEFPGLGTCPVNPGQRAHHGMVTGMASKKVTITLDEAQLERIRALVEAGVAPSVSGFVQHAVGVTLDDVAGWGALLAEALQETGGALADSERAWADEVLGVPQRGGRPAA